MEHAVDWPVIYWTWITMGFLFIVSIWLSKNLKKVPGWLQYLAESFMRFVVSSLETAVGPDDTPKFTAFIAALALFILFTNLVGMIPGAHQPTSDFNTTIGLAIISFIVYNAVGIKRQGLINYFKHMMGEIKLLAPLIFPIEIISHFSRILSLSLRLFGNMFGDEMIVWVLLKLVPLIVPVLGILIVFGNSILQAYIFTVLTIVYISLALKGEEEH